MDTPPILCTLFPVLCLLYYCRPHLPSVPSVLLPNYRPNPLLYTHYTIVHFIVYSSLYYVLLTLFSVLLLFFL